MLPNAALASPVCKRIFSAKTQVSVLPIFEQTYEVVNAVEALRLFERSNRKRRKEIEHMKSDLKALEGVLEARLEKHPYVGEFIAKWDSFNKYWLEKVEEYKTLPPEKQKQLKEYMEIPLSLSIKHFISFLEAPRHTKWKLNRLNNLLTIHEAHRSVDVEAALFLINREALKTYSRWDFIRCRY